MYRSFFGLRCLPFEDRADTQFFYAAPDREEVLAALEYEAHYGKGSALLVAEAGAGKTLLIRTLLTRMQFKHRAVVLRCPENGAMDLVRETCKGFGVTLPASYRQARGLARLRRHLTRTVQSGHRSIIIIDQAENLTTESLGRLAALSDLHSGAGKLLTIILVAQPRLKSVLDRSEFARVRQQFFGERILSPLTQAETGEYIQHRLRVAAAPESDLFEGDAVAMIHQASGGIPRLINHICNAAMLVAYGAGRKRIRREMVLEVAGANVSKERSADTRDVVVPTAPVATDWSRGVDVTTPPRPPSKPAPQKTGVTSGATGLRRDLSDGAGVLASGKDKSGSDDALVLAPEATTHSAMVLPLENGEALLERLERVLARAERMASMQEASVARYMAVEKHVASLTESGKRLAERLSRSVQQATGSLDRIDERVEETIGAAERRAKAVAVDAAHVVEVSDKAAGHVQRIEDACEHADQVEARLAAFAEQLVDKADEVQQRLSLLMNGLASGESVQDKLQATLEQASTFVTQADARVDAQRAKLKEATNEAERFREKFTDAALESYGQKLESRFEGTEQARLEAVEAAHTRLQSSLDQVATVTADAEAKTHALTEQLRETVREGEQHLSRCIDAALRNHQDSFREQFEALDRRRVETLEPAQHELQRLLEQASSVATEADARIGALRTSLQETVAQTQRMQQESAETTLESCRKRLQDDLEAHQRSQREAIEAAETEHERIRQQTAIVVAEAEKTVEALHSKLQERLEDAGRVAERFTDTALDRAQQKLEAQEESQRKVVEATISAHRAKLQELIEGSASQMQRADATLAASQEKTDEAIADSKRSWAELIDRIRADMGDANQRIETLETRNVDLRSSAVLLGDQLEGAATRAGEVTHTTEIIRSSVDELGKRADLARESFAAAVERGEKLASDVHSLCGQLEARQHSVANSLIDIGSACERLASVREQVHHYEEVVAQLASGTSAGEQVVKQFSEQAASAEQLLENIQRAVAEGGKLREAVQRLVGEAAEKIGKLDSHNAAASHVFRELSEANVTAHRLVGQASDSVSAAKHATAAAAEQLDRLMAAQTAGADTVHQLDEIVASASRLQETAHQTVTDAAERIGQLDTHNATAGHLIRDLSEANATGSSILARAGDAMRTSQEMAENAKEHIERLVQNVWSLTTTTETHAKQLTDCNARAEEFIETLNKSAGSASAVTEELAGYIEQAQDKVKSMEGTCGKADGLIEQLDTIRCVLSSASETEESVKKTLERAQAAYNQLSSTTENAGQCSETLGNLAAEAQSLIRTQQEHTQEAEALVQRLTGQLTAGQSSLETGEHLLNEFVAHTENVNARLEGLHRKTAEVEQAVAQATVKPSEILAKAQAQAGQLERVCGAVGKVFAGLSQATLEARNHTKEFSGARQEATERLTRLTTETDRASKTLREWTEEAVRVQSRLEQTLQNCPSIHETHPPDNLLTLAQATKPFSRIANPSADTELNILPESQPGRDQLDHSGEREETAKASARAEEISTLIDDAKQAATAGKK